MEPANWALSPSRPPKPGTTALDGFEPFGEVTAGGRGWELHTQQTGDLIVGLALTEIGDLTYGIVLQAPVEIAESQLDTVVVPALEAFEVTDTPIGSDPFQGMEVDSVDIDGHAVAYVAGGTGTPTVVFEAGLGSNGMDSWALVAPDVAEHARVFAYDRPGYGGSDLTESPRDAATMVDDLRQLLVTTGHEPPYLLVGHSLGGTLMDLFARTHPDEVAGLVLVDSRHHEYTERCVAQFGPADCDVPTDEEVAGVAQPILGEWRALPYTEAQLSARPTAHATCRSPSSSPASRAGHQRPSSCGVRPNRSTPTKSPARTSSSPKTATTPSPRGNPN